MRRFVIAAVIAAGIAVAPAPAFADRGDRYDQREGCGEQGGGCNNEREETYGSGSCKYFCPAFDRSPVEDSFNPVVCLPGATCYTDGRQPPPEREPAPGPAGG